MKTRCRSCRTLIPFGESYCEKCFLNYKKQRQKYTTKRVREADKLTKTAIWQSLRQKIIIRDKGCCVLCFLRGRVEYRKLQVHHIVKRVDDLSLAYEPSNLVTLCRKCHEEVEKLSPAQQRVLLEIEKDVSNEEFHFLL